MSNQDALFGANYTKFDDGPMVKAVEEAVKALTEAGPLPPIKQALVQVAIELARNIEAGNRKGRAIGNEAMQIAAVLQALEDQDAGDETAAEDLPEDVAALLNALAALPTVPEPVRPAP